MIKKGSAGFQPANLSTVRNARRIVVMEDGRIVETGSHADLLSAGGLYRRLYEMQFAQEEEKDESWSAISRG